MSRLYSVLNALATRARQIETGSVVSGGVPAGGSVEHTISFTKTFTSAPKIALTMWTTSTSTSYHLMTVVADSVTTTGFTIRFINAHSASLNPGVYWTAIGPEN